MSSSLVAYFYRFSDLIAFTVSGILSRARSTVSASHCTIWLYSAHTHGSDHTGFKQVATCIYKLNCKLFRHPQLHLYFDSIQLKYWLVEVTQAIDDALGCNRGNMPLCSCQINDISDAMLVGALRLLLDLDRHCPSVQQPSSSAKPCRPRARSCAAFELLCLCC